VGNTDGGNKMYRGLVTLSWVSDGEVPSIGFAPLGLLGSRRPFRGHSLALPPFEEV